MVSFLLDCVFIWPEIKCPKTLGQINTDCLKKTCTHLVIGITYWERYVYVCAYVSVRFMYEKRKLCNYTKTHLNHPNIHIQNNTFISLHALYIYCICKLNTCSHA